MAGPLKTLQNFCVLNKKVFVLASSSIPSVRPLARPLQIYTYVQNQFYSLNNVFELLLFMLFRLLHGGGVVEKMLRICRLVELVVTDTFQKQLFYPS